MKENNKGQSLPNIPAASRTHKRIVYIIVSVLCLLMAAAAYTLISLPSIENLSAHSSLQPVDQTEALYKLIFTCALVAIVEEIIFRGILLQALARILKPKAVILITAAAFAVLHGVPFGLEGSTSPDSCLIIASLLLKTIQAFSFGIIMAAFIFCGLNLFGVIVIHAVFDIIYFERYVFMIGDFPTTYVAVFPEALIALAVSAAILAGPAAFAFRTI